jgi:hypothetical protein
VRRTTRALLTFPLLSALVPTLSASIPPQRSVATRNSGLDPDVHIIHRIGKEFVYPFDSHPFSTEFYLRQFASESAEANGRQQRSSWFSVRPVTNAASSLSRRVANLRRALVRMMP